MPKQKITCQASGCRFWGLKDTCHSNKTIAISSRGECTSFEKGLLYYVNLVWSALYKKNYIDAVEIELDPDLRFGMSYVAALFHLEIFVTNFGTCRMLTFETPDSDTGLNYQEIVKLDVDADRLSQLSAAFCEGNTPDTDFFNDVQGTDQLKDKPFMRPINKDIEDDDEYGWLSPSGEFFASPWGSHEQKAREICSQKNWKQEYQEYGIQNSYRDFLSGVKGFCLIHNPSLGRGYIVTHSKPLTKKQREFLYDFFAARGDFIFANHYFDDLQGIWLPLNVMCVSPLTILKQAIYGEEEPDDITQWEPMKELQNRIAFCGEGWLRHASTYWLQNPWVPRDPASKNLFLTVDGFGNRAGCDWPAARGIRVVFQAENKH